MKQFNQDMEIVARLFHKMEKLEIRIAALEKPEFRDTLLESLKTLKSLIATNLDQRLSQEAEIPLISQLREVRSKLQAINTKIDKKDQIFVTMLELLAQMDALTKVFKQKEKKGGYLPCENVQAGLMDSMKKMNRRWDSPEFLLAGPSLVFLKCLSNIYGRHHRQLQKARRRNKQIFPDDYREYAGAHILNIPSRSRWERLIKLAADKTSSGLIPELNEAMDLVEQFNRDIFFNILFNNYHVYGNEQEQLTEFMNVLEAIPAVAGLPGDGMADVFLKLIRNSVQLGFPNLGYFCIPSSVMRLLIQLVDPSEGFICDHACGFGQLFAELMRYTGQKKINPERIQCFGQEKNEIFYRLCRMLLPMLRMDGSQIVCPGKPAPTIPPPAMRADYLFSSAGMEENYISWIESALDILADGGRAGLLFPKNAIESGSRDIAFRSSLLEKNTLKCVISLHLPASGQYTPFPLTIWLMEKPKSHRKQKKSLPGAEILFIRLSAEKIGKDASLLHGPIFKKLVQLCRNSPARSPHMDIKGFSKLATPETIEKNNFSLAPESYI